MVFEMSKEDIKCRVEQILSEILSDKHDMKITLKFKEPEESRTDEGRSNKAASRHRANAGGRARRPSR